MTSMQVQPGEPSGQSSARIHPIRNLPPAGRLLFAGGLFLALPAMHGQVVFPLLILMLCVVLLGWINAGFLPVWRAVRLLLWLVMPVLLLHMLFTPGALIWPGSALPFTREGTQKGGLLALMICTMFFAAMLLSRSLSRDEWVQFCLRLPLIGSRMMPYVQLSPVMRGLASRALAEARADLKAGWRDAVRLPGVLADLFAGVWHGARTEAVTALEHWGESPQACGPYPARLAGTILGIAGFAIACLAWVQG